MLSHIMNITISIWFSVDKDRRVRRYLGWSVESKESLFMKVGDTTAHECSDGVSQVEREY